MAEVTSHATGSFCWSELNTTDPAAAKQFYGAVFGWEPVDTPAGPDMVYTMLRMRGLDIGAMCEMPAAQKQQGVPAHWNLYIAVESAEAAAQKAVQLGGQQLMLHEVGAQGRLAVLQDPQGAVLSVWQAGTHFGSRLVGEFGTFCWGELWTSDCAKAADYYSGLFGWGAKIGSPGAPSEYTEWQLGEQSIGGMMAIKPEMGPVPPNWLPYFMVENCDATVSKALAAGGTACVEPMDIPQVGRFSVISDPQGGMFAVIALLPMG